MNNETKLSLSVCACALCSSKNAQTFTVDRWFISKLPNSDYFFKMSHISSNQIGEGCICWFMSNQLYKKEKDFFTSLRYASSQALTQMCINPSHIPQLDWGHVTDIIEPGMVWWELEHVHRYCSPYWQHLMQQGGGYAN